MLTKNHISYVLDIPKIEPDNWNVWWNIWHQHSSPVIKNKENHNRNSSLDAIGLEIYKKDTSISTDPYKFHYFDTEKYFPKMFKTIRQLPINLKSIIALSSKKSISPHTDFLYNTYSIRTMLFNNNNKPVFYYLLKDKISYKKIYQEFPLESNTWCYDDKYHHGSTFYEGFYKIILIYVCDIFNDEFSNLLSSSQNKYPNYVLNFN